MFFKGECVAFKKGKPLEYPVSSAGVKVSQEHELELLRVFVVKKGKLLVYRKNDSEWLSGQYEVPTFVIKTTDEKFKQYQTLKAEAVEVSGSYKTGITKYKIQNKVALADEKSFKKMGFVRKVEWRDLSASDANFSTATQKGLLKFILKS